MNTTHKSNGVAQNGLAKSEEGMAVVLTDNEKKANEFSNLPSARTVEEVQAKINQLKSKSDEAVRLKSHILEISELQFSKESGRGKVIFIDDNNTQFEIKNTDTINDLKNHVITIGKEHINRVETALLSAQLENKILFLPPLGRGSGWGLKRKALSCAVTLERALFKMYYHTQN